MPLLVSPASPGGSTVAIGSIGTRSQTGILATLLTTVVLTTAVSATSHASHASLLVVNWSGQTIVRFYASPSYADKWGRDRLGNGVLRHGYQQEFDLSDGFSDNCIYDLKAETRDGQTLTRFDENVCGKTWTLYKD